MRYGIFLVTALLLVGCATPTPKTLYPTGGSRSDGMVELSYEYGAFEQPQVNQEQGLVAARSRCRAWGYGDAEAFGSIKQQCQQVNGYGSCLRATVTIPYQCTGSPEQRAAPIVNIPPTPPKYNKKRIEKGEQEYRDTLSKTTNK